MSNPTYPVFFTLGSNIAPETHLPRAVHLLGQRFELRAVSRVYQTAPINAAGQIAPDQGYFLNAAVLVDTAMSPRDLKYNVLRFIEALMGRTRTADKFAPRVIDLDLVLYGDQVIDDPPVHITLPDPDILTRAHVALPLADLAPEFVHPLTGQTLAAIAASLATQAAITLRTDLPLLP